MAYPYIDDTDTQFPQGPDDPPPAPPPTPPPTPAPTETGNPPRTEAERRQQIIDGFVIPGYRDILGRDPTSAEIEEGFAFFQAGGQGGDAFRAGLRGRLGNAPTGGSAGGGDWFAQHAPSTSDFGAPAAPFGETYTAGTYAPPTFNEPFQAPTAESLSTDPGYRARMDASQRGFERSAAAKGSILSGGFIGRTLPRALQEQASNEYASSFQRAMDTYQQRYGQFSDSAARDANAFQLNETGKLNQFSTRYKGYQDSILNRRNAETDRFGRELDLARLGLDATAAGRPS